MNRCDAEFNRRHEHKSEELSRGEQLARMPLSFEVLLGTQLLHLASISTPDELADFAERYRSRLSSRQLRRFVSFAQRRFGTPFARRAGLPVGPPPLKLAS